MYDVGSNRYRNIFQYFDENAMKPRYHGKIGKKSLSKHAMIMEEHEDVITFISANSEKDAIPLPGRMANFTDYKVV